MAVLDDATDRVVEIAIIGDLTEHEADLTERLLSVPHGGSATLYINSPGGSAYSAMALLSFISLRRLQLTAVVTGECSSAALWLFAACGRRLVTPTSVFLFHPMKWQSEEHVELSEAAEWARHFGRLETSMDALLAQYLQISEKKLRRWMEPGRYLSGPELVAAGIAELVDLSPPWQWETVPPSATKRSSRQAKVATR